MFNRAPLRAGIVEDLYKNYKFSDNGEIKPVMCEMQPKFFLRGNIVTEEGGRKLSRFVNLRY